jgi:tetratricopeptide (TPR) repeat protein
MNAAVEWVAQARQLRRQGRLAEAVSAQAQAVQLDEGQADMWNDLGALQRAAGQPEAALGSLVSALQLDPQHRLATSNFAQALQALERHEDAALAFDRLLKLWP